MLRFSALTVAGAALDFHQLPKITKPLTYKARLQQMSRVEGGLKPSTSSGCAQSTPPKRPLAPRRGSAAFDAESRKWIVVDRVPQIMESCAELYLFYVSERIVGVDDNEMIVDVQRTCIAALSAGHGYVHHHTLNEHSVSQLSRCPLQSRPDGRDNQPCVKESTCLLGHRQFGYPHFRRDRSCNRQPSRELLKQFRLHEIKNSGQPQTSRLSS